ncbi:coiled-coil domain-containing protein 113-like [Sitophilus oryzae]|uniref:Cilia- and flagella-associated protein 263 n=1 Tax=Sitophilus oryzae TaxID=7048 RepID=A0A6J2YSD3_SITOR|nr:coiled-coil domain-containing protein 113-like [Sitophilus oryzae]
MSGQEIQKSEKSAEGVPINEEEKTMTDASVKSGDNASEVQPNEKPGPSEEGNIVSISEPEKLVGGDTTEEEKGEDEDDIETDVESNETSDKLTTDDEASRENQPEDTAKSEVEDSEGRTIQEPPIKTDEESVPDKENDEIAKEPHPLDEFTDQQVIDLVNEMEMDHRHLELENILFETFLKENDPNLLDDMDNIMSYIQRRSFMSTTELQEKPSRQKFRLDSFTSLTSIAEGRGPKINITQKTEMVMRSMEDIQAELERFLKRCHVTKRNLKAELEEFSIREAEIKEATDIFEYNIVIQGVDKLTQRIPAEKFVRYMEEWLKSAQFQIEKLRLRIATMKVQYKRVSQQLIQRQELGENVHAVDFDQLEIENKHFLQKIDQKNIHLIELKKMNGSANLILSIHKKYLQKQQEEYNSLNSQIEEKKNQIKQTEEEYDATEEELDQFERKYDQCRNLKESYTVPEVKEYMKLKEEMYELKKNIKVWSRRKKIQDIALNTCLREMKKLTGSEEVDPRWFEDVTSIPSLSSSEML